MGLVRSVCLFLTAVPVVGQQTEPCPFPAARLTASAPAEVAWAAAQLTREACRAPSVVDGLVAALRSMRAGTTEEHHLAVLHVLHAACRYRVTIPMAELRFEPAADARIPWLFLQVRAATKDGRDLFELFRSLDETQDLGWELVGTELAERGHATFAVELRTTMTPTLHVCAGSTALDALVGPFVFSGNPLPAGDPGWPPTPHYAWERDGNARLVWRVYGPSDWRPEPLVPDQRSRERARLRWLAALMGESRNWAERFEVHYPRPNLANFVRFAQQAEQRARESLAAADAKLRADFRLPERVLLPGLEVVWDDLRPEAAKVAHPMPERK